MSRQIDRLKTNFKSLSILSYLVSKSINDLPKLIIEKYGVFFKQIYARDMLNLINLHRKPFGLREYSKKVFAPTIDAKFNHIERNLKKMHDKVSALVFKYKDIQQAKRMGIEASIVFMVAYFEDFLKESLKKQINNKPDRSFNFIEKQIRITDLKNFGFDLSKKMGEIVVNKINFQNLNEAFNVYKKAFRFDIFNKNTVLKKRVIKIFQIRHLIIHNNSIVDKNYIKIVKHRQSQLGGKVNITVKDLETYKSTLLEMAAHIEKNL